MASDDGRVSIEPELIAAIGQLVLENVRLRAQVRALLVERTERTGDGRPATNGVAHEEAQEVLG